MSALLEAPGALLLADHPGLIEDIRQGEVHGWRAYPLPALLAFLRRLPQRFPGMQINALRPFAADGENEESIVGFTWAPERVLEAGLLPPEVLPQGSKRVSTEPFPILDPDGWVHVRKVRGGAIKVSVNVPDCIRLDHPLAFFRVKSIREGLARPVLRLVVDNTRVQR